MSRLNPPQTERKLGRSTKDMHPTLNEVHDQGKIITMMTKQSTSYAEY